ncbi:MAG: class I SAM-dependent methyltransferase [Flavobacteriales bacterium]|nr:class I SAM-dependent methyltransferase [Flavobacteriales bacterium]
MSDSLQRIGSWLGHVVKARTRHGVHSPFVYTLADQVLRTVAPADESGPIEALREAILHSDRTIRVNDLGAGSRVFDLPIRRVADIARTSLKPPRHAQLLFRLARWMRPAQVLELGTSFGISTLYLARGADEGHVTTVEGCPQTHRIAQDHFDRLQQRNITPLLGSFQKRLPEALERIGQLDMVFLDGHHAKAPTLDYFQQCLAKAHNDTLIVVDDIHWSRGMEEAWEAIKEHPMVTVTIDLYDMGLVFLRREQAKEHFTLRY